MNPLIKWPGGKSSEIYRIQPFIPEYNRYIEPFFGGGALFFHLQPQTSIINDISFLLMDFYRLIKEQDKILYDLLLCYNDSFLNIVNLCNINYANILNLYELLLNGNATKLELESKISNLTSSILENLSNSFFQKLILNKNHFIDHINKMVLDKLQRTVKNNLKNPFSAEDLKDNLITGFTSGYYMYFRSIYNDINLKRIKSPSPQYTIANFYFIREYCYGSMFRYNSKGEFNIPYGGISYNKKNFKNKIDNMFNNSTLETLKNTTICCSDFEDFLNNIQFNENDFIFLDPPYDTDFSDYDGRAFTENDQKRLANYLKNITAKFILIIKNTDFIYNLYKDDFNIFSFDKQYTYNIRSRNERKVEHLIITNIPISL